MKKRILLLLLTLVIFFPLKVKALTINYDDIIISCPKVSNTLDVGQEFTCFFGLLVDSPVKIDYVYLNYSLSGLEVVSHTNTNGWTVKTRNKNVIEVSETSTYGMELNGDFIELKFRVTSTTPGANLKINVTNAYFMLQGFPDQFRFGNISKDFKVSSCTNTLTNLILNGNPISDFNTNVTSFNYIAERSSIDIDPVKQCSSAKISGTTGNKELSYGVNKFTFAVTSPGGIKRNYTLNVTLNDTRDKNSNLKNLSVKEGTIPFTQDRTDYELTIPYKYENLNLYYETESAKATVVVSGEQNLQVGENIVKIVVAAENGEQKTYTLIVTRQEKPLLFLEKLEVKGFSLDFNPGKLNYVINAEKFVRKLDITYKTGNKSDRVIINGNKSLKNGYNVISIKVADESGEELEYLINFTQERNNDALILIIMIGSGLGFVVLTILYLRKKLRRRKFFDDFNDVDDDYE